MVKGIRQTPNGTWEVAYYVNGKRKSKTCKSMIEATIFKQKQDAAKKDSTLMIGQVVDKYLHDPLNDIAYSTRDVLQQLTTINDPVDSIDYNWAVRWIDGMKKKGLTPDTIKKKVAPLARVLNWHYIAIGEPERFNYLKNLERGYANHKSKSITNEKRERRLLPGEYETAVAAILTTWRGNNRERVYACSDEDRANFLMLFQLLVRTGLRLREALTLRVGDVNFNSCVITSRLPDAGHKKHSRSVPIRSELRQPLQHFISTQHANSGVDEPLFLFWSGSYDRSCLESMGNALSRRFAKLFEYCGMEDITCHDLRHEAICQWLELKDADGNWLYRQEQVRVISGHSSTAAFDRYCSFRAEDLAEHFQTA